MMSRARTVVCFVVLGLLSGLGGCGSAVAPRLGVTGVEVVERTDEAGVLQFIVTGENLNGFELPLRDVEYAVSVDGREVFRGQRSARATLPRFGKQEMFLPASVLTEDWPAGVFVARLTGWVTYEVPGSIAELLFDANVRRPSARFSGTLEVDGSADAEESTAGG